MEQISESNFDKEVFQSDIPVFVDFGAEWCAPCKILGGILASFAEDNEGKVKVGYVDVDSNAELAVQYKISNVPQIIIFKGGEQVQTLVGVQTKERLQKELDKIA